MAKGQKKSNKETRKPKKDKATASAAPQPLFANASMTPAGGAKKKG
jgi:hypothetical protein